MVKYEIQARLDTVMYLLGIAQQAGTPLYSFQSQIGFVFELDLGIISEWS